MKTLQLSMNGKGKEATRVKILLGFEAPESKRSLNFIDRAFAAADPQRPEQVKKARTCRRIRFHMGQLSDFSTRLHKRADLLLEECLRY